MVGMFMSSTTTSKFFPFFIRPSACGPLCAIVSTGYGNASLDRSPLRNAIDGFLQKPYQLEELSKSMREAIDRSRNGT
jgi:FixJ family two-component response regulator